MKLSLQEDDVVALRATSKTFDKTNRKLTFGTDMEVFIPSGFVGVITPAQSLSDTLLQFFDREFLPSGWHKVTVSFDPGPRPKKNYEIGDMVALLKVSKP